MNQHHESNSTIVPRRKPHRWWQPDRRPCRCTDERGEPVVHVPLSDGQREAVLDARDFDRLMDGGLTDQWAINGNGRATEYVRAHLPGKSGRLVSVHRLIVGATRHQRVSFRDGNPLNLRRRNLLIRGIRRDTRKSDTTKPSAKPRH